MDIVGIADLIACQLIEVGLQPRSIACHTRLCASLHFGFCRTLTFCRVEILVVSPCGALSSFLGLLVSLLSLLRWWMDRGAKESPKAMDEMFHRMVWKGLQ